MQITPLTRISVLIKHNKDSIDAIASIAKPLEKLKNPILRKIMASRVNIAEAAKLSDTHIKDFARVLKPLGFELIDTEEEDEIQNTTTPDWLKNMDKTTIENFDVRAILASGDDPLKQIIKRFKEVEIGNTLCIINSFVPTPLINLLQKDGVKTHTIALNPNEFHSYFFKSTSLKPIREENTSEQVFMDNDERFQELYDSFPKDKIKEIDVRHLEMPMPMQTILQELAVLEKGNALYVNHKRIPIYLLEELADQDFQIHVLNIEENNVKLLIFNR